MSAPKASSPSQKRSRKTQPKFSAAWMGRFLEDAAASADLRGACVRADVSLVEVQRARAQDVAFDQAMCEVDDALRLAARAQVTAAAAAGDLKAVKLLGAGMPGLEPPETAEPAVAERVAAAVLAAATAASEGLEACPHCRRPYITPGFELVTTPSQLGDGFALYGRLTRDGTFEPADGAPLPGGAPPRDLAGLIAAVREAGPRQTYAGGRS